MSRVACDPGSANGQTSAGRRLLGPIASAEVLWKLTASEGLVFEQSAGAAKQPI